MENGPPTSGFEDGAIDVERLLVEPQDGHVSVDSVISFHEKIPENSMNQEETSHNFGVSTAGIALENQDILNRDVLVSMQNEVEVGYFRMQNDFCSMGEDYLLGVEFAESITNLDYGLSGGLQTSVSDGTILPSTAGIDASWKVDPFRIMELSKCRRDHLNIDSSDYGEISDCHHEPETLAKKKPLELPTALPDLGKFNDISSCSFQLSDENDSSHSPSIEVMSNPKNEKTSEVVVKEQGIFMQDRVVTLSDQASSVDAFPKQKRSRKPTQRYIDEVAEAFSRQCKKRREASSSALKDKSLRIVNDNKKSYMVCRASRLPAEEPSVKAIQVPFASISQKECPNSRSDQMLHGSDRRNLTSKSRDDLTTPDDDKERDDCTRSGHLKKTDDNLKAPCMKKRVNYGGASHLRKRDYNPRPLSQKKWDEMLVESPRKGDDCLTALRQMKRDYYIAAESHEEVSSRRKHHRLWTIAEVRKLIDGVSKYGVGRWSRIKKLFFSSSTHRTAVDLKDKWRNLLKASGIQGQGNQQGEKKRNLAWRPLPKCILRSVCELATMHPYPKDRKPKIAGLLCDSPDRSADITLSDYRRILRSINSN
ncbi:uncharacterized protein LOC127251806 [Andrographis paniculata]|uniref:uncharacterized protein LOC127251806 n=1 Tax=Andrographis paniculata TaxID=175694 RepID=UPI0021E98C19|nr:uncharacterized protein LOC127251806 [Andrographis paniculata]